MSDQETKQVDLGQYQGGKSTILKLDSIPLYSPVYLAVIQNWIAWIYACAHTTDSLVLDLEKENCTVEHVPT